MADFYDRRVSVACLSNIVDLQKSCQALNVKLSGETKQYMLYLTLKKLGPLLAQKLINNLAKRGEIEWEDDFEVDAILDHCVEEGKDFYYIKWKGWSSKFNTWEPVENLNCPDLVQDYHDLVTQDGLAKRRHAYDNDDADERECKRQRLDHLFDKLSRSPYKNKISPLRLLQTSQSEAMKKLANPANKVPKIKHARVSMNKKSKSYQHRRCEVLAELKQWEQHLNAINTDPSIITVENNVDLEGPPGNFTYINDYMPQEGITVPDDPIVGCECEDCYYQKKQCCPENSGFPFAYTSAGRVRVPAGTPIYECNKRCNCPSTCPNRVVQFGRKVKVSIFRTANGRGWGVKTLQRIKKGSFVMEYVGEIITNEEAEQRGLQYDAEGMTYLFDLDYNGEDCPFTVDARFYGNVAHFVNHSCDPNLSVYGVWINNLDPRLPRICLFAKRDIARGEELTFDYMMTGDTTVNNKTQEESMNQSESNSVDNLQDQQSTNIVERQSEKTSETESPEDAESNSEIDVLNDSISSSSSFFHRNKPASRTDKYKIMCQCGASNCRKYLF